MSEPSKAALEAAEEIHSKWRYESGWQNDAAKIIDDKMADVIKGAARYEAIRKLSPRRLYEIHTRNMHGENFDDMIDELVVK